MNPEFLTINKFAEDGDHDPRTVRRRVRANGITPVTTAGRVAYYRASDLDRVTADISEKIEGEDYPYNTESPGYRGGVEMGKDSAI